MVFDKNAIQAFVLFFAILIMIGIFFSIMKPPR